MKNTLFVFLISSFYLNSFAQVGINTDTPKSMVDVRGDMTVREKIYVGGSDTELGEPGKKGQVLVSQGADKPAVWKSLNIPDFKPGDFYMIFTNAYSDNVGLQFSNSETIGGNPLYSKNDLRSDSKFNNWKDINGLIKNFHVYNTQNKVYMTYEAVVQVSGSGSGSVDFACGVFVNDRLQGVRVETVKQGSSANHAFHTFLMIVIAEDINEGDNEAKVSCARIRNNNYTNNFGLGRAIETNINNFVAQSSFRIEVYEIPENFIPVVD